MKKEYILKSTINELTIVPTAKIKEAMEALEKTAKKVLLVVDKRQRLIGSLTDGDVRRCILGGGDLKGTIEYAYNKDPIFVYKKDANEEKIKQLLAKYKVDLIPTLDENRRIIGYTTWEKAFGSNKLTDNQKLNMPVVIIEGAMKGTRLVPMGEKPIIEHIIDKFREYGVNEFYVTLHHISKSLRVYFEQDQLEFSIEFAEINTRGTAGSIKLFGHKFNKPFFVSNCDVIINTDYRDIYSFHVKNCHEITLVVSAKQFNIPYGVCELNGVGNLDRIQEKPSYSFLVNTGMYILNHNTIELIPDDKFFNITQLIDKVKENNGTIGIFPVSEKAWIDIRQWAEYRKALKTIDGI